MSILLDVIFLLIVLICVLVSAKKGFVRSLVETLGYVLAIILVVNFSGLVSEYVYGAFVEEPIISAVETAITEQSSKAIENLPDYINALLSKTNFDFNSIQGVDNANQIAVGVAESIEPFVLSIFKTIVSFVIFIVSLIIAKVLAKFINSLFKGAVLGTANKFLGGVLGVVKGGAIGVLYSLIVYLITVLPTVEFLNFTTDALNNSVICKYIVNLVVGNF